MVHSLTEYAITVPSDEKCCHLACYPITAEGVVENIGAPAALKDPRGQFIRPDDRVYETQEEFLDDWERRTAKEKTGAAKS
jgi:hypothetical protein